MFENQLSVENEPFILVGLVSRLIKNGTCELETRLLFLRGLGGFVPNFLKPNRFLVYKKAG